MPYRLHYINLDQRTDRSQQFQRELAHMGLASVEAGPFYAPGTVIRFPAIERSPAWMGCRDSHIRLIQLAQRDNLDFIVVFEDDAKFIVTDKQYYNNLFVECGLAPIFDIPKSVGNGLRYAKKTNLSPVHILYLCANTHEPLRKAGKHTYHAYKVRSTSAIVYTREIYQRILDDYLRGNIRKIDLYLENIIQPKGGCYVASQLCCTQQAGFSDIEGRMVDYAFIEERFRQYVNPDGVLPYQN